MEIGPEKPAIVIEPVEDPFKRDAPEPRPEREPEKVPVREPEKVPAGWSAADDAALLELLLVGVER